MKTIEYSVLATGGAGETPTPPVSTPPKWWKYDFFSVLTDFFPVLSFLFPLFSLILQQNFVNNLKEL